MDFNYSDEVLTKDGKSRAEVCTFCDRHLPPLKTLSPAGRDLWKMAASVANYLEIRLKG